MSTPRARDLHAVSTGVGAAVSTGVGAAVSTAVTTAVTTGGAETTTRRPADAPGAPRTAMAAVLRSTQAVHPRSI